MNQAASKLLIAENIAKVVDAPGGALNILESTNLTIQVGEQVAIIGPSGSGKTTLLGLLAGLDLPSQGKIWFQDQEITAMDEDQRARLRSGAVGFVFQSFHLLASLTAIENVMLPLELAESDKAQQAAAAVLEQVGLGHRMDHYPNQLSGGERQRVAIARAFATSPALLFADEPTGNLDAATGEQISDLLFELNRSHGTTLVLVTHDQRLADRCARVVRLEGGAVAEDSAATASPVLEQVTA